MLELADTEFGQCVFLRRVGCDDVGEVLVEGLDGFSIAVHAQHVHSPRLKLEGEGSAEAA